MELPDAWIYPGHLRENTASLCRVFKCVLQPQDVELWRLCTFGKLALENEVDVRKTVRVIGNVVTGTVITENDYFVAFVTRRFSLLPSAVDECKISDKGLVSLISSHAIRELAARTCAALWYTCSYTLA